MSGAEIYRRLMAGKVDGIPPLARAAIGKRTVQTKASRARELVRTEADKPDVDSALSSLDAIMLDALTAAKAEITRITRRTKVARRKSGDAASMRDWCKVAPEIARYFEQRKRSPAAAAEAEHRRDGLDRAGRSATPSTLHRLAARSRERGAAENGDAPHP